MTLIAPYHIFYDKNLSLLVQVFVCKREHIHLFDLIGGGDTDTLKEYLTLKI